MDVETVKRIVKIVANVVISDDEARALLQREGFSHSSQYCHHPLVEQLVGGRYSETQHGRMFVALSLAEAETIRRIMHCRQGTDILPSMSSGGTSMSSDGTSSLALRCLPAGYIITDKSHNFAALQREAEAEEAEVRRPPFMIASSYEVLRFFNSEMYISPSSLNTLLRALHSTTRRERRLYFKNILMCRRRSTRKWTETPISRVFTIPDFFYLAKQKAQAVRSYLIRLLYIYYRT
jgi:hypothetical protein